VLGVRRRIEAVRAGRRYVGGPAGGDDNRRLTALDGAVRSAVGGSGRILAGPWRGDLGYELLYWLPFLRGLVHRHPELRGRLVAISRGGVASWYADIATTYADIFELLELDELRRLAGRDAVVGFKPKELDALDRALLARAAEQLGIPEPGVLAPSLVSVLMRLSKAGAGSAGDAVLRFEPIEPPRDAQNGLDLPDRFVAVRFYANSPLPGTPETVRAIDGLMAGLAERFPLVVLSHSLGVDPHSDITLPAGAHVISIADRMEAHTNLAVQTAVIARATAFVGTYGGLSYLAPHVGTPAFAFYSLPAKMNPVYLRLARRAAAELDETYVALDVANTSLRELFAALA